MFFEVKQKFVKNYESRAIQSSFRVAYTYLCIHHIYINAHLRVYTCIFSSSSFTVTMVKRPQNMPIQPLLLTSISFAVILNYIRIMMYYSYSNCSLENAYFKPLCMNSLLLSIFSVHVSRLHRNFVFRSRSFFAL